MSNLHTNKLHLAVNQSNNLNDLLPFLHYLPISDIKQFIHQSINKSSSRKKMYFESISINDILPSDLIQYILSFNALDSFSAKYAKIVNTNWRKLSNSNQRNYYLQIIQMLNKNSPISYDNNKNNTFIIHPKRKRPTLIEKQFGFKGPYNDIFSKNDYSYTYRLSFEINKGDRILIYPGDYKIHQDENKDDLYDYYMEMHIKQDVTIIGLGDKPPTIINKSPLHHATLKIADKTQVYMENISFQSKIIATQHSKLHLNRCYPKCQSDEKEMICIEAKAKVHINKCLIYNKRQKNHAIWIAINGQRITINKTTLEMQQNVSAIINIQKSYNNDHHEIDTSTGIKIHNKKIDYLQWNSDDVLKWIYSLENRLFLKYRDLLRRAITEKRITGSDLQDIACCDIREWGITNFSHRLLLYDNIETFIEENENNNEYDHNLTIIIKKTAYEIITKGIIYNK